MAFDEACFSEKEMHDIELFKNDLGLGITVAGYVCDEEEISGIFVKDVCAGSAAHLEGKIRKNDRIVKVNNKSLTDLSNQEAIEFLRNSGDVVLLTIERYLEGSNLKRLSRYIRSQTLPTIASQSFEKPSKRGVFNCKSEVNLDVLPEYDPVSSANLKLDKVSLPISPLCKNCDLSLKSSSNQNSSNIKEIKEEKNSIYLNLKQNLSTACNTLLPNSFNIGMVDANNEISQIIAKSDISANSDSIYFSKTSDDTEKDGYETCMDESLSDEGLVKNKVMENSCDVIQSEVLCAINVSSGNVDLPGECSVNKNDNFVTSSDECLDYDRNFNNNLEIYSDPSEMTDADEFFLVEYVNDNVPDENDINFLRESEVPYSYEVQTSVTYKCIKLHEYYNDFEDCLEEYKTYLDNSNQKASNTLSNCDDSYSCNQSLNTLTTDDDILVQSNFLFKCNSDPQLYYFEKLEVSDINSNKRRASYLSDYKDDLECNQSEMTVTSKQQGFNIKSQQNSSASLKRYWTSVKNIQVHRNSSEKLGISIVCGKVDFHTPYNESWETTSGIFVKSILPNSAAGNTGQFQIGDRILEVNGIALSDIGHEEAASVIRSATNPITFVVQSLVPPLQNELGEDSENFKIEPYNGTIEQNNKLNEELKTETKKSENEETKSQLKEHENEEKVDTPKQIVLEKSEKSEDGIPSPDILPKQEETKDSESVPGVPEIAVSAVDILPEQKDSENDPGVPAISADDIVLPEQTETNSEKIPKETEVGATPIVVPVTAQQPKNDSDDDDDDEEDDDFEDERELEGRLFTKKGIQIDRSSAGNVKRTSEEIAADAEEEDEFGYTTDLSRRTVDDPKKLEPLARNPVFGNPKSKIEFD